MDNAIAIRVGERTVGYLLAEGGMGYTQGDESFLINRLTRAALTAGLIAGGLALLLSLLLAYSLMRPVRELTQAARKLGEGDLSQRVRSKGSDELALLGSTFNSMADSLQQSEEKRKSMTADIAHELRNPLAVQRANLEALQDGVYPLTPQAFVPVLEQNLVGRIFGYGDLDILTAADVAIDRYRMLNQAPAFKKVMLDMKHELEQELGRVPNPPARGPEPARGPMSSDDVSRALKSLTALRDSGAISADDFEAQKKELLGRL